MIFRADLLRSRFFWKLFGSYSLVVAVTSIVLGAIAHEQMKRSNRRAVESALRTELGSLVLMGPELFLNPLRADIAGRVSRLARESHSRVTAILPDGRVLYDSDADPAHMENHGDRPEIRMARETGFGLVRRFSHTLKILEIYAAAPVIRDGKAVGYLRAAVPLDDEEIQLARMRRYLGLGALAAVLLALGLGAWVARRITRPLEDMRVVAEAMGGGEYDRRVSRLPKDEVGLLGDTLNRLGSELQIRISNLAHEEAQLRGILSSMVEGVIAVDSFETVLYHNRAATDLLGRDVEGLSGKKIWQFTELRELRDMAEAVSESGEAARKEIRLSLDGGERVLNLHAAPFASAVSKGAILVLQDLTDLRRLEGVRRDFVANVSHELKTPLTSIKGYVETLLEGALHDDKHNTRFLEKIDKHVGHLTELVQDLLALGEIESDARKMALEACDWRRTADEVVGRYELEFSQKRLQCRRETEESVAVWGDASALFQIASNLVSNALKYTSEGGTVSVRTYAKESWGCLEVVDTGVGIPEKDLPRIFERFYRVDKARSREVGGTGLGLAIVKHLVNAMDGEIRVESRVGVGSKFIVKLPRPAVVV